MDQRISGLGFAPCERRLNIETWPMLVATRRERATSGNYRSAGAPDVHTLRSPLSPPLSAEYLRDDDERRNDTRDFVSLGTGHTSLACLSSVLDVLRSISGRAARLAWMNNYQWTARTTSSFPSFSLPFLLFCRTPSTPYRPAWDRSPFDVDCFRINDPPRDQLLSGHFVEHLRFSGRNYTYFAKIYFCNLIIL